MECVACGASVSENDALSLLIGWACEKCVPRGVQVPIQVRRAEGPADRGFVSRYLDELCGFRLSGIDVELCVVRHGSELEGFWKLPLRDEFYLFRDLKGGQDGH